MTIFSSDIKLLASDTMTDAPEGGGSMTASVIVDNVSNNIFDDISTLDRVYGAVHLRKVFGAVNTQTTEKYFGSHVIVSKLPGDTKIGVNLFSTNDWFDRRASAKSRVEAYRAQGAIYSGFLWARHYAGSKALTIFQREDVSLPGIGDVLVLQDSSHTQYVKILTIESTVQTFSTGTESFNRRILDITLVSALLYDFDGIEITKSDIAVSPTKLYKTVVANAAKYYSARPLALPAASGAYQVRVDTVYTSVIPASQAEIAIVDADAASQSAPIIESSTNVYSFDVSNLLSAGSSLYLGIACLPGSLSIAYTGGTLTDDSGNLKSGSTIVGTVNYAQGTVTFGSASPPYSGTKTISFRPATAPMTVADTDYIDVTEANRGFNWTRQLVPAPKPGSLRIAYRALGNWYELYDNYAGGIVAGEPGIGSGTINYTTGSIVLTTSVLPDAETKILFAWGMSVDTTNRSNITPDVVAVEHTVAHLDISPQTLVVTWNDGVARTASSDYKGTITGDATGNLNLANGVVALKPNTIPLGNTVFNYDYNYGPVTEETNPAFGYSANNLTVTAIGSIIPGTFRMSWTAHGVYPHRGGEVVSGSVSYLAYDDGSGSLYMRISGGSQLSVGTIDYLSGLATVLINPSFSITSASVPIWGWVWGANGVGLGGWHITNYTGVTIFADIVESVTSIQYREAGAATSASETETLTAMSLDLTPGFSERIVPNSVMFNLGGTVFSDYLGGIYYNRNTSTGAATYAGSIDYLSGVVTLQVFPTNVSNTNTLISLLTALGIKPVANMTFRTKAAPLKVGVLQITASQAADGGLVIEGAPGIPNTINATAQPSGLIEAPGVTGTVDYEMGIVELRFGDLILAAGHETEDWYDPAAVDGTGHIFRPAPILADTLRYNTVSYKSIPLSAEILGLDPVRLPSDGRVPVYQTGDVAVVLHDKTTVDTYTNGTTLDLGRGRIAKLTVRDFAGQALPTLSYTADLDTGIISWVDLTGVSQPLTIVDRIEDMSVIADVQITGQLSLSSALTHNFPANETLVSNAMIYGTLFARTSVPFDQQTWTNVWADTDIGSTVSAQYNSVQYPIVVNNQSCIQERWAIIFTSATLYNLVGEYLGQIKTGHALSLDLAPINPNTNQPYFTMPALGFGSGWAAGNVIRFNTYAANAPAWIIQAVGQGVATDPDFSFKIELRGDVNNIL